MPFVLIVCTANICRSPMAEVLLREKLAARRDAAEWRVESAGTWAANGIPASANGATVMRERGLDLTSHQSQQVSEELMAAADVVLTMTGGHAEALQADFLLHAGKVHRLAEMAGLAYNVADPYGGDVEDYRRTADELERLLEQGLDRIVQLAREITNRR
jgi:protein-tyrosine phosphatase